MKENFFERFGVMVDQSRNAVMNKDSVKRFIDIIEKMGYDSLMLYTEDTYEITDQPYFGHQRGRYSKEELKELVLYADEHHIELIPCIQTLAHLNAIMRWPQYNKLRDCHDILRAGDEGVYSLIEDMFASINECFTSRTVHIGMDEAAFIGLGTYMKEHGIKDRMEILLSHLKRVSEIASKYGYGIVMWGDMFYKLTGDGTNEAARFDESLKEKIPKNVTLVYWDYYSAEKSHYDERIENYQRLQNIWFAGGTWTWTGFAPHLSFSAKNSEAAMRSCKEHGIRQYFTTMWGDDGGECSRFSVIPELYRLSCAARGITDISEIKSGFFDMFGIEYDDFMLAELPDTPNTDGNSRFNPDKYMLYNDCFTGLMDATVNGTEAARYAACAERLEKMRGDKNFGLVFESLYRLCRVLEIKYDIGVKTRAAYKKGDVSALRELVPVYDELLSRMRGFYTAYEKQWMWENKPHGFDVIDIRLGGVIMRITHAKERLTAFIDGNLEKIEELEEEALIVNPEKNKPGETVSCSSWARSASANVLTWPTW